MRILMIAPEPFFQPRGTPFSEYYRTRALTELGHEVDMVTYPIGEDVSIPGLRIFRAPGIPGIRKISIGPSLAKLPLDVMVFSSAVRRLMSGRYDLLDCHEEAGLMGVLLSKLFGVPAVYDMHSSLPEQLVNFRYTRSAVLRKLFAILERWTIKGSAAVIVICPYLQEVVADVDPEKPCFLIENSPLAEANRVAGSEEVTALRKSLGLEGTAVIGYTGTFEAYQGLDLLFDAVRWIAERDPSARLLMVGGHPDQIDEARGAIQQRGLEDKVVFVGQRPPAEMSVYLAAADVLVSPRSHGNNTPLKIYSYLRAGKAIAATRLLTHTQVLDDEISQLTAADPEAFGKGILTLLRDPNRAQALGEAARRRAENEYSYENYLEKTRLVLDFLSRTAEPEQAVPSQAPSK
ncbi:MAG: glycosyltransferase family 4 protein [Vicinamibacteria bacterium]